MFFRATSGLVLGLLTGLAPAQSTAPVKVLFGTYAFRKPTEVYKQFQPVALELSRLLSAELGMPATVEMVITKTYEACLDDFVAGKFDIVRFGPSSYVLAKQRCPKVELLAAEREDSHGVGLIVVRKDSQITSLADLAGKKFAFGDDQSTIGRFLSQAELVRAGVTAADLAGFDYLQRHDNVFKAVEIGDYAAGALHIDTFKELDAKATTKLRVLHAFDNAPKPWIVRAGFDPKVADGLRRSLLRMKDPEALKALKVPGFDPTTDANYEFVRTGMKDAERFAPRKEQTTPAQVLPAPVPPPTPGKG